MSDPNDSAAPAPFSRELAAVELEAARRSHRVRLAQAAARVRIALSELEGGILEALLQEAAINLAGRTCPGRPGCAADVRRIVAGAVLARLGDVLEPYLDPEDDWRASPDGAEADLCALAALPADEDDEP